MPVDVVKPADNQTGITPGDQALQSTIEAQLRELEALMQQYQQLLSQQ